MSDPPCCSTDDDDDQALLKDAKRRNEAYDIELNMKLKQICVSVVILVFLVCCLIWCQPCLLAVIGFSACYCVKEPVLVVVFLVSVGMYVAAHMPSSQTMWKVTGTMYELQKSLS